MKLIKIVLLILFCGSCIKKEVPIKSVDFSQEDCVLGEDLKLLNGNEKFKVKFKNVKYCPPIAFSPRRLSFERAFGVGVKICEESELLNMKKIHLIGEKGLVSLDFKEKDDWMVYFRKEIKYSELRSVLSVDLAFLDEDSRKSHETFFFDRPIFLTQEIQLLPTVENFSVEFNRVEDGKVEDLFSGEGCYSGKSKRFHYHYCLQDDKLKIYKGGKYIGEIKTPSLKDFFERTPFKYENTWYFPLRLEKEGLVLIFQRGEKWYLTSLKPICKKRTVTNEMYPRIFEEEMRNNKITK